MADVDFLFDFISPYTYLARTQLDGIAARTRARFRMWPMHILNLMKTVGNTPTTVVCSNKRKYAGQDIGRWCARYQVPLKLNPHLMKGDHSLTLRGALVAQEMNLEDRYNGAMFSAFWTDAVNINDRAELVRHLEAAGLEGSAILKKAEETEYAKRLEANTQLAAERVLLVHRPLSSATMFSLGTIDSTSSKKVSGRTCPRSVFEAIRRPS